MTQKVDPALWLDVDFLKLSAEQKLIVLTLCLNDSTTDDGIYEATNEAVLNMSKILGMAPTSWTSVVNGISAQENSLLRTLSSIATPYIQIDLGKLGRYFPRFKKDAR